MGRTEFKSYRLEALYKGGMQNSAFKDECLGHDLRTGIYSYLLDSMQSWKWSMCIRLLLSRAGYVNQLKGHYNK